MKKFLFLLLFVFSISRLTVGQNIVHDTSYMKMTNYLWYTSDLFKDIASKQTVEKRDEVLPQITSLIACARLEFENLKKNHPTDTRISKFEQWIQLEEKNIESISGEEWRSKPIWQMGNALVVFAMKAIIDNELCK